MIERNGQVQATNETPITCAYCQCTIQPGKGIYLEDSQAMTQTEHMGWFHYPMCVWQIEARWAQEKRGN